MGTRSITEGKKMCQNNISVFLSLPQSNRKIRKGFIDRMTCVSSPLVAMAKLSVDEIRIKDHHYLY